MPWNRNCPTKSHELFGVHVLFAGLYPEKLMFVELVSGFFNEATEISENFQAIFVEDSRILGYWPWR